MGFARDDQPADQVARFVALAERFVALRLPLVGTGPVALALRELILADRRGNDVDRHVLGAARGDDVAERVAYDPPARSAVSVRRRRPRLRLDSPRVGMIVDGPHDLL